MTFNYFMELLITLAPAITAVGAIIAAVLNIKGMLKEATDNVAGNMQEVKQEIYNTKEYTELKEQLKVVYQENIELKKKLNKLLTQIDKINREE